MDSIAEAVGIPKDQLILVGGLLLSVLLSFVVKTIKNPLLKIGINIVLGSFLQWSLYGTQIIYVWVEILVIYLICKFFPRKRIGQWVMLQSGIFLLFIQFKRFLSSITINVDITAILMISTSKFIIFAFCYQDGGVTIQSLNYPKQQGPRRLQQLPSFFEYLGYIQFLPSAMIGPTFQFIDYRNYIYCRQDFTHIPNTLFAVVKQLKKSVFFIVIYLVLDSIFKIDYIISEEYMKLGYFMQIVYLLIVIIAFKFKYYTAWSLSTLGIKASGIGYQKITTKQGKVIQNFERIQYADPVAIELNPSFKVKIDSWNICVQVFFRRYLYQRLVSPTQQASPKGAKLKKRAQQLTLLYSTFWHGFYPGYLLSFFHWMLVLQITQQVFRVGRKSVKLHNFYSRSKIFQTFTIILSTYAFSWIGTFFHLYHLDRIWLFTSIHWYIQFVLIYAFWILIVKVKVLNYFVPKIEKVQSFNTKLNKKQQQVKEN